MDRSSSAVPRGTTLLGCQTNPASSEVFHALQHAHWHHAASARRRSPPFARCLLRIAFLERAGGRRLHPSSRLRRDQAIPLLAGKAPGAARVTSAPCASMLATPALGGRAPQL